MDYSEKLKDPHWQKKRQEVFAEKGNHCLECHSEEFIEIYHTKYTTPDPWDEPTENLIPLCECCHVLTHDEHIGPQRKAERSGSDEPQSLREIIPEFIDRLTSSWCADG